MIPIYKKENLLLLQNYRPISLLSAFSKILEKAVHTRLLSYLNRCKTLSKFQFGFRPNHSTSAACNCLANKITKHFGNNKIALTVFLDLSKAFDVLDHQILLNKLYQYGFRGLSHAWLTSYLANRSQQVYIHGKLSAVTLIDTGVPQGSNLGSLLFLIYVNDLFLDTTAELIMYADDMTLIVPGKSRADVVNIANEQHVRIFSRLTNNKLIVNAAKTKYMILSTKSRNTKTTCETDTQLKIATVAISEVDNFKFLGVIVSNNLSWKAHILCVQNKLRACLALI